MAATSARQLPTPTADADDPSARRLLTVLLRRYGIPIADTVIADGPDSAVEAAWWLGFPVTLVAEGTRLTGHAGITRFGLATPAQVRAAYWQLAASVGPAMTGVQIRRQPQQGAEVIVRVTRDAESGTRLTLLLGGPPAALVGACVSRSAPLTASGAWEMLHELHGTPAPSGQEESAAEPAAPSHAAAGPPALDLSALAGLLERVSRLVTAVPQITELELNPVVVTRSGAAVAGVRGQFRRFRAGSAGWAGSARRAKLRRVS